MIYYRTKNIKLINNRYKTIIDNKYESVVSGFMKFGAILITIFIATAAII